MVTTEYPHGQDFPILRVETALCRAEISLYGGHVIEWTPAGHLPVIFMSPKAVFQQGKALRGGSPIPFDRVLGVRCGAKAIELVEQGKFGETVALRRNDMVSMPIEEAVRTLHLVDGESQLVAEAKEIGISFGDDTPLRI